MLRSVVFSPKAVEELAREKNAASRTYRSGRIVLSLEIDVLGRIADGMCHKPTNQKSATKWTPLESMSDVCSLLCH